MDLIDRDALLEQIDIDSDGNEGQYGDEWQFMDTIENMPSIPQWILCSERLPSEDDYSCLVNVIAEDRSYPIIIAPTYKVEDMYRNEWINAWMPLPKPYKEADHE